MACRRGFVGGAASALVLALASAAGAVDGVLEINQACASTSGCFSGDSPGFPVAIGTAGSYRLTGNLSVPDEDTTAISISVDAVTVDLNGFSIVGPFDCSGGPPITAGSGDGIVATGAHVHVRNGIVRGVGRDGVSLGDDGRVEALTVSCSGRDGIRSGARSRVTENHVTQSGGNALTLGTGSSYGGNTLADNAGSHIAGSMLSELRTNVCDASTSCLCLGDYLSQPATSYFCASGAVSYSVSTWTFTDVGGGTMDVTGDGLSPVLSGAKAVCPGGSFNVSASLPGSCTETYTLTGTFSDADTWSGTFDVTFSGSCLDCVNQSTAVSGSRP